MVKNGITMLWHPPWGRSSNDVWAGIECHYDGTQWSIIEGVYLPKNTISEINVILGFKSNDAYAGGAGGEQVGGFLHYDGALWSTMAGGSQEVIKDMWGTSRSNIYAVCVGGGILHFNGDSWSDMVQAYSKGTLWGVWGSSRTDIYAVGDYESIKYPTLRWKALVSHG